MKKITLILFAFFTQGLQLVFGQSNVIANPKSSSIIAKKVAGSDLLIPIEVDFVNPTNSVRMPTIVIQIDNTSSDAISQIDAADFANVSVVNNSQQINLSAGATAKPTNGFFILIDRTVRVVNDKIIFLRISEGLNTLNNIKLTIQPDDQVYTLQQYLDSSNRLDYVIKVESSNNILTINGYREITANGQTTDVFFKRNVAIGSNEVLAVNEWSFPWNPRHWKPIPFSLTTIPFKVRPQITANGNDFKSSATSGITSIGFNLDLAKYQMDRYFPTGKKSTHKFSLGFWAAPSVEELNSIYTNGFLENDETLKQLFFSTGITLSYSYNDISFVFVPVGWDFGTSTVGKKWVYDGQRWWGFGIGISPKIFATILNK